MNAFFRTARLTAVFVAYCAFVQLVPDGGLTVFTVGFMSAFVALLVGQRLAFATRLLITTAILHFGYGMCLAGRTMAPGLTRYTVRMAVGLFAGLTLLPLLTLFCF
jgi:hypothetical protein